MRSKLEYLFLTTASRALQIPRKPLHAQPPSANGKGQRANPHHPEVSTAFEVDACWFRACILRTTSKAAAKARPGRFRTTDQPPRSRPAGKKGRRKPTSQSESGFISESEPQVKLYRNLRRAHSFAGECFAVPFVRPGRLGDEAPAETGIPTESRGKRSPLRTSPEAST